MGAMELLMCGSVKPDVIALHQIPPYQMEIQNIALSSSAVGTTFSWTVAQQELQQEVETHSYPRPTGTGTATYKSPRIKWVWQK
jgi:hypothetical protein